MPMSINGQVLDYEPGCTYEPRDGVRTEEEAKKERADGRLYAIEQYKKAAQASTRGQIDQAVGQLLALCLQLRALGGSGSGSGLPEKLREAADFLEDL